MDEYVKKLMEQENNDLNRLKGGHLEIKSSEKEEKSRRTKNNILELKKEEKRLNEQLDKLRRENFELQVSIESYQVTLAQKMAEFKEAETELNDLYMGIWLEREKFCEKADEFEERQGLLSDWWKKQTHLVESLENLNKNKREKQETETFDSGNEIWCDENESDNKQDSTIIKSTVLNDSKETEKVVDLTLQFNVPNQNVGNINSVLENTQEYDNSFSTDLFPMMDVEKLKLLRTRLTRFPKNKF